MEISLTFLLSTGWTVVRLLFPCLVHLRVDNGGRGGQVSAAPWELQPLGCCSLWGVQGGSCVCFLAVVALSQRFSTSLSFVALPLGVSTLPSSFGLVVEWRDSGSVAVLDFLLLLSGEWKSFSFSSWLSSGFFLPSLPFLAIFLPDLVWILVR